MLRFDKEGGKFDAPYWNLPGCQFYAVTEDYDERKSEEMRIKQQEADEWVTLSKYEAAKYDDNGNRRKTIWDKFIGLFKSNEKAKKKSGGFEPLSDQI